MFCERRRVSAELEGFCAGSWRRGGDGRSAGHGRRGTGKRAICVVVCVFVSFLFVWRLVSIGHAMSKAQNTSLMSEHACFLLRMYFSVSSGIVFFSQILRSEFRFFRTKSQKI